jgi:hypothetical protein
VAVTGYPSTHATTGTSRAYLVLYVGYVLLPLAAGIDKFFHALTNWTQYLWRAVPQSLHVSSDMFMKGVGIVEIVAGLLVAFSPRIGGWTVALWLWGITINLIMTGTYYDVALRDFGLSIGAVALACLARDNRARVP